MHNLLCYGLTKDLSTILNRDLKTPHKIIATTKIVEFEELIKSNMLINLIIFQVNSKEELNILKSLKKNTQTIHQNIPVIFLINNPCEQNLENILHYGADFLLLPINEYEFSLRIELHLKKIDKKFNNEFIFNQYIFDAQQNIIFIHDDKGLVNANKSFYDFFKIKSIQEFKRKHGNIIDLFMEYENYFSYHVVNDNKPWISDIKKRKNTNYNVLLMNYSTFQPETFLIDVNAIPNCDKFVVTLTNITELTMKSKEFELKANYDSLTGIYNRNKFNAFIDEQFNFFRRYNDDKCLALFDIDFFKQVNDKYGHIAGDDLLIRFTKLINDNIRNTDMFARWGGEEFTLLLPNTNLENGLKVVENLRHIISKVKFKTVGNQTCSIGITQFKKGDKSVEEIFKRVDEALYEAKRSGRNKVCKR